MKQEEHAVDSFYSILILQESEIRFNDQFKNKIRQVQSEMTANNIFPPHKLDDLMKILEDNLNLKKKNKRINKKV